MYYILVIANFITLGLLVGGLFYVNMAVVPTFIALSTGRYAEFHHVLDQYSDPYMPILTFSTALLGLVELWFTHSPWQFVSRLIGITCIVSVAIISISVHGPLNRRIRTWQPDGQIENLSEIRVRWVAGHRYHTGFYWPGSFVASSGVSCLSATSKLAFSCQRYPFKYSCIHANT